MNDEASTTNINNNYIQKEKKKRFGLHVANLFYFYNTNYNNSKNIEPIKLSINSY
jgi:hypothetical protein